ncbi:MAG: glutamine--tRNA ligase, partial [Proteobacteria bacterium]|nr:glutamine--tRNA ligase [Pseudomonadota bacterium]
YTHCISDAIEEITHSLCDTGFEDHRPLYDWVLAQLEVPGRPQQIEFSRLNLQYTVTSKRKLKQLVDENLVEGWNDPRMPTIAGMRRRGYPPEAIRDFCRRIGITKSDNNVELALLESCVREALEPTAPRAMAVLDPVKVVITNLPESETIWLTVQNHPKDPDMGQRSVPFTREIFIDRADFQMEANRKYKRLVLQDEVRLRGGYVIKAESVVMGDQDDILEIHGVYDPETLGVNPPDRKIRGVIHWVSASENMPAVFHRFEPLFSVPFPDAVDEDYRDLINPNSRSVFQGFAEVSLKNQPQDTRFQFEREGYFILDEAAEDEGSVCYNEIVGLRDSWSKGG